MTLTYRIREAALDDNDRLIELIRLCPMKGHLQVYLDRYPDYFAMTRLQGDRSFVYVAEDARHDLVGSVVLIERHEYWEGSQVKVLHITDLRTAPAWRGTRIAAKFVEIYRNKLLSEGYHHGCAEIMDGNLAPIKAHRLLGEKVKVSYDGAMNLYQLLPAWNYQPDKRYKYRRAEQRDLVILARLLHANYGECIGAPSFNIQYMERMTNQHGSFGVEDIWLAEDTQGEILACLAAWDQKNLRRTVPVQLSLFYRLVMYLLAWLATIWQLPPPLVEGTPLRCLYLRWPACRPGQTVALRNLVRLIMRDLRQQHEVQFVALGFHEKDRLQSCLRGIIKLKSKVHLYTHLVLTPVEATRLPALPQNPVHYLDFALV